MGENGFCRIDHGGISAPQHVVGINNHINAPLGQFLFGDMIVRRRYDHYGNR